MGHWMANSVREEGPEMAGSPEFALVARAMLSLDDVDDYGRSNNLEIITTTQDARDNNLPLFGQICCRLKARPVLKMKPVVKEDPAGGGGCSWTPFFFLPVQPPHLLLVVSRRSREREAILHADTCLGLLHAAGPHLRHRW